MKPFKLLLLTASIILLGSLVAACTRSSTVLPQDTETPDSSLTPSPSPPGAAEAAYIIDFSDDDCLFTIPGELGEITTVFQTDVDNEPKINIDRIFDRFHQSEMPSTILRCDMSSAGLFTTWWIQSLENEQAAQELFEAFMESTATAVAKHNQEPLICSGIQSQSSEMPDQYALSFINRGICSGVVFEGKSGLIRYKNNVIGIDSRFYEEFFDLIMSHAESVIDRKAK
ncbi:MAG: hypothetical protein ACE5KI_00060 [Dehalococcoidia bacterium]